MSADVRVELRDERTVRILPIARLGHHFKAYVEALEAEGVRRVRGRFNDGWESVASLRQVPEVVRAVSLAGLQVEIPAEVRLRLVALEDEGAQRADRVEVDEGPRGRCGFVHGGPWCPACGVAAGAVEPDGGGRGGCSVCGASGVVMIEADDGAQVCDRCWRAKVASVPPPAPIGRSRGRSRQASPVQPDLTGWRWGRR